MVALFIHVPPLDKPYSANQLAEAIAIVLKAIVKMIFIHVPPLDKPYSANQLAEAIAIVLENIVKMIEI